MRNDELNRGSRMTDIDDREEPALPVVKGDWVESNEGANPQIGRIVGSFWHVEKDGTRVCMVNLSVYANSGERLGRVSPAEGGPKAYEPWIRYTGEW